MGDRLRLADHILAARGTGFDFGAFATRLGRVIEQAQRFEIGDDVAKACGQLVFSRPSSLLAALPLCRLPYETMWVECRGGLGQAENLRKDFDDAPVPWKQGVLVEAFEGQRGFMSFAWMHNHYADIDKVLDHPVNSTPIGIYFDWRADGDVRHVASTAHDMIEKGAPPDEAQWIGAFRRYVEQKWHALNSPERVAHFMTGFDPWSKFKKDDREIEALLALDRHMLPGLAPHSLGIAARILSAAKTQEDARHFCMKWEADMQGEGTWVQCLLAMLNSKNPVVEHAQVDLTKLNKARRKSGKAPFLGYAKTRLKMSRVQANIARANGIDRETARQHLVRGHFKIRATGVFWWSPFLRGDARKGEVKRQEYQAV